MAALAAAATTSGHSATDAQVTTSTKSAQTTGSSRSAKPTGTSKGTGNVAQTTAAAIADSGAQPAPFVVITVPAPVQPNSTIAEAALDGHTAQSTAMEEVSAASHSRSQSTGESAVEGFAPSSSATGDKTSGTASVAAGKPAAQGVSSSTRSATEDSDEAGQAVEALKEDGAESGETAFQNSDEETAQLSGLKDALRTVASAEPQASVAVAKSSPQTAAERSAQTTNGQAQRSQAGIAVADGGSGLLSAATAASTRNAALSGQYAASVAKTLGHGAGGTTQSNASQSDTTQSSAHKWNAHENSNAQQTATTSSNTHAAQVTDGAAKAEKVRDGGSDAMTGNAASTTAAASAAVTANAEASTSAQSLTAIASAAMSAAMTATSTTGTTPTRPTMPASAETQAATVATSQNSTLDTAHLRTTAGGAELKVSVQLPDLGRVEVRAVTSANGTQAHLTTEHHATAVALSSGRDGLEAALRTHDVTLGSLTTQSEAQGGHERNQPEPQRASGANNNERDTDGLQTTSASESETIPLPEYSSISVLV